jgi:hypothetical protein
MSYNRLKSENPGKYPARLGEPWTEEDIKQLLDDVKNKLSHEEIATKHERSVGGIRARLKELAADYYFNNELPVDKIQKYTGLTVEEISDCISKRQWKMDNATPKKSKAQPSQQILQNQPTQQDTSELKEMLVVLKDIQSMMKQFLEGNYVRVKKTN